MANRDFGGGRDGFRGGAGDYGRESHRDRDMDDYGTERDREGGRSGEYGRGGGQSGYRGAEAPRYGSGMDRDDERGFPEGGRSGGSGGGYAGGSRGYSGQQEGGRESGGRDLFGYYGEGRGDYDRDRAGMRDRHDQGGIGGHGGRGMDLGDRNPSQGFTGGYGGAQSDRDRGRMDHGGSYASSGGGSYQEFDPYRGGNFGRASGGEAGPVRDEESRGYGGTGFGGHVGGYGTHGSAYGGAHGGFSQADYGDRAQSGMQSGMQRGGMMGGMIGGMIGGAVDGMRSGMRQGRGSRHYQRSDSRIQEDVYETLERQHDVDASDVQVQVQNGEVTLSGEVEDRRSKRRIEEIVEHCAGVRDVHNNLKARRGLMERMADALGMGGSTDEGRTRSDRDVTTNTMTASQDRTTGGMGVGTTPERDKKTTQNVTGIAGGGTSADATKNR